MDDDRVELVWPGKYVDGQRAPLLDHGASLIERERFGDAPNQLICGDNSLVLEALVRDAPESIDLVYIDPPFATGQRFALARRLGDKRAGTHAELRLPAFDDAWDGGLAGFLRMLDPRLRLLHRLLAPTGSLYLHVDPTVGHAVKLLLDEIFGPGCFQREIVWRIGWVSGFKSRARNWIRNHDLIFFYVKDPQQFTFNKMWVPHPDGYERRAGEAAKAPGVAIDDVWNAGTSELSLSGRESLDSIQIKSFSREKTGWATQKNESLLRRIIAASSNPGDRVADVFAGSGTTAAVAAELGRRFVICDHADAAVQIARQRLLMADVSFALLELDDVELAQRLADIEPGTLKRWLLEQLGATHIDDDGPFAGRRGDIGLAIALPKQVVTAAMLEQLERDAKARGLVGVELAGFEWATDDLALASPRATSVVPVQVGRGLFEASVRATSWLDGGVAVWERPQLIVDVRVTGSQARIELLDVHLRRPEHLPAPLCERGVDERVIGWSLARAEEPSVPVFVAVPNSSGALERVAELSGVELSHEWRIAVEDVCGHRHVRRLIPQT